MLLRTNVYIDGDEAAEYQSLGISSPPPELCSYVLRMEAVASYEPNQHPEAPGTCLTLNSGVQCVVTETFDEFDALFTKWYESLHAHQTT